MGRHCCPDCEDHPILDEALNCYSCGGHYTWIKKETFAKTKLNANCTKGERNED